MSKHTTIWVLILISTFLLQTLTISFLPGIGQDEVQITDYGRLSVYPFSNWSMTWMIRDEKPLLLWSYLGPLIAEISFLIGGPSGIGPRIASLIGGLLASTMALGWLSARRVPYFVSLCLSVAFLLDPLFTLSQRMGRSDSWVMVLCLASCWLLRSSIQNPNANTNYRVIFAGASASAAALVWPSAFLLYPLILVELWELLKSEPKRKQKFLQMCRFFCGGLFTLFLLLIPIRQNLYVIFSDMMNMIALNVDASKSSIEKATAIFNFHNWLKLVKTFAKTFSPLLPILALLSLFFRRQISLQLATLCALVLIFSSLIYEFRLLYLLPYFIALGGGVFDQFSKSPLTSKGYLINKTVIISCFVWAIVVSIFIRSGYALEKEAQYDRKKINYAADTYIGPGHHKVFLAFTYEFYFAGRALGWELYTPYIEYSYDKLGNWKREKDYQPKDKFQKLLSKMDYAVFTKGSVTDDVKNQLEQADLIYKQTIIINEAEQDTINEDGNRNNKILMTFLFGYKNYGSYLLYERKKLADVGMKRKLSGQ